VSGWSEPSTRSWSGTTIERLAWAFPYLQVIGTAANGAIDERADPVVHSSVLDTRPGRFLEGRSCGLKYPAVVARSLYAADLLEVLHVCMVTSTRSARNARWRTTLTLWGISSIQPGDVRGVAGVSHALVESVLCASPRSARHCASLGKLAIRSVRRKPATWPVSSRDRWPRAEEAGSLPRPRSRRVLRSTPTHRRGQGWRGRAARPSAAASHSLPAGVV